MQRPGDPLRILDGFEPRARAHLDVYDLIGRRWRHVDTRTEIRHQKELIDQPVLAALERHDKARNPHAYSVQFTVGSVRAGLKGRHAALAEVIVHRWRRRGIVVAS